MQHHRVPAVLQCHRSVHDQSLGATDAQVGVEEGDAHLLGLRNGAAAEGPTGHPAARTQQEQQQRRQQQCSERDRLHRHAACWRGGQKSGLQPSLFVFSPLSALSSRQHGAHSMLFALALAVPSMAASAPAPKIVIAGAGLHGSALAYYLTRRGVKPIVVEQHSVAAAASGKGGGFLARDWGSGPTTQLHKVSYALHEELAETLGITSYRKIPVLRVSPGARPSEQLLSAHGPSEQPISAHGSVP